VARISISTDSLTMLLRGGFQLSKDDQGNYWLDFLRDCNVPADLEVIHADWDFSSLRVVLVCRSNSFAPVKPGELPPCIYVDPTVHRRRMFVSMEQI